MSYLFIFKKNKKIEDKPAKFLWKQITLWRFSQDLSRFFYYYFLFCGICKHFYYDFSMWLSIQLKFNSHRLDGIMWNINNKFSQVLANHISRLFLKLKHIAIWSYLSLLKSISWDAFTSESFFYLIQQTGKGKQIFISCSISIAKKVISHAFFIFIFFFLRRKLLKWHVAMKGLRRNFLVFFFCENIKIMIH